MKLFREEHMEQAFSENGFVVLPGFLSHEQLAEIHTLVEEHRIGEGVLNMYSNLESNDRELSQMIGDFLIEKFGEGLEKHFVDYDVVGSSFLFKGPGKQSDSRLHQDWNIVDETIDRSAVIWVPLHDVDEQNGCLVSVPGSNRWKPTIRSSNIDSIHLRFTKKLDRFITSIPAKAGDAIVYGLHTFHGSKPNASGQLRKAAVVSISNKGAVPVHYVRDAAGERVYKVHGDSDFMYDMYFKLHRGEQVGLEGLKVIEEVPHPERYKITEADFYTYLGEQPGLGDRLRRWVGKLKGEAQ